MYSVTGRVNNGEAATLKVTESLRVRKEVAKRTVFKTPGFNYIKYRITLFKNDIQV